MCLSSKDVTSLSDCEIQQLYQSGTPTPPSAPRSPFARSNNKWFYSFSHLNRWPFFLDVTTRPAVLLFLVL